MAARGSRQSNFPADHGTSGLESVSNPTELAAVERGLLLDVIEDGGPGCIEEADEKLAVRAMLAGVRGGQLRATQRVDRPLRLAVHEEDLSSVKLRLEAPVHLAEGPVPPPLVLRPLGEAPRVRVGYGFARAEEAGQ